jgi:hypothetical protein
VWQTFAGPQCVLRDFSELKLITEPGRKVLVRASGDLRMRNRLPGFVSIQTNRVDAAEQQIESATGRSQLRSWLEDQHGGVYPVSVSGGETGHARTARLKLAPGEIQKTTNALVER